VTSRDEEAALRKEQGPGTAEAVSLDDIRRDVDRLSRELSCLIELEALTLEEEAALSAFLEDLVTLLVRARRSALFAAADTHELYEMAELLASDLDHAYQRLSSAA